MVNDVLSPDEAFKLLAEVLRSEAQAVALRNGGETIALLMPKSYLLSSMKPVATIYGVPFYVWPHGKHDGKESS